MRRVPHRLVVIVATAATAAAAPLQQAVSSDCPNAHHSDVECSTWAKGGECDKNFAFMRTNCAKACGTCGWRDTRCTKRSYPRPAKRNGEIHSTFERALTFEQYGPRVHSRPPKGPWIITFDNFLSEDEAEAFITTTDHHFQRSLAGDMVSPVRTSKQAWCQPGIAPDCVDHPLVQRVHERVVNVTSVPKPNAEFFQVLRYEPGQFYKVHHDQNTDADSLAGVRLFTFFIYLRRPESGGQTFFPWPNVTIQPKAGSALLWHNVKDEDVRVADMRTEHEALPPIAGRKFSANLWIHQYDFRGPNMQGCNMGERVAHNAAAEHGIDDGDGGHPTGGDGDGDEDDGVRLEL